MGRGMRAAWERLWVEEKRGDPILNRSKKALAFAKRVYWTVMMVHRYLSISPSRPQERVTRNPPVPAEDLAGLDCNEI